MPFPGLKPGSWNDAAIKKYPACASSAAPEQLSAVRAVPLYYRHDSSPEKLRRRWTRHVIPAPQRRSFVLSLFLRLLFCSTAMLRVSIAY